MYSGHPLTMHRCRRRRLKASLFTGICCELQALSSRPAVGDARGRETSELPGAAGEAGAKADKGGKDEAGNCCERAG